ncbi:hypothetical protein H7J06_15615 [Mycobacterium hodleri]|uniref:hypothetical protein n=1 Tax=Mycolicibacterium hodleri TaxID=49897 RepID=UPI0021F2A645|nr:hypothetical protein [Mycolicibacterium hodleri]MCV7134416.1 hypothetical protein [Mycolicibacterium hodleri]
MRDDLLVLDVHDAARQLAALETLERLTAARGGRILADVARDKQMFARFIATRVAARDDARTRGLDGPAAHDARMDSRTAAECLGITEGAVRLACRSGRYAGVAGKKRGRWSIPVADVDAEVARRA